MSPPTLRGKNAAQWRGVLASWAYVFPVFGPFGGILLYYSSPNGFAYQMGVGLAAGTSSSLVTSFVLWRVQLRRERRYYAHSKQRPGGEWGES